MVVSGSNHISFIGDILKLRMKFYLKLLKTCLIACEISYENSCRNPCLISKFHLEYIIVRNFVWIISSYGISHKSTWDVYNFIWNFIYEISYQNQHFIWNFTWSMLLEISFFVRDRCLVAGDIIELFRCSYANNNVVLLKCVDLRWSADTNTWLSFWAVITVMS